MMNDIHAEPGLAPETEASASQPVATMINEQCWSTIEIEPGRYFNAQPVTGFEIKQGPKGNPLHGSLEPAFEQALAQRFIKASNDRPDLELKRLHFAMPDMNPGALPSPQDYLPLPVPRSLQSTSMTLAWVKQDKVKNTCLGYHFNSSQLPDLRERLSQGADFSGLIGNLGYFMTKELNVGNHIWSHQRRYPDPAQQLPELLSYLGFYYFGDGQGNVETAGFQSAHDAAVGIDNQGKVHVLPSVTCHRFDVAIRGGEFTVTDFNPALNSVEQHDIALFNVNYPFEHQGPLVEFAPTLPLEGRVNVFVANRGDGHKPGEEVVAIWHGESPLPSFGTLLSFKRSVFDSLFEHGLSVGDKVQVKPYANEVNLSEFTQVLGGLVPSVINGQSIVPTGPAVTALQAEQALDAVANTDSPLARTGKETNNFDALIREPSGLFIETEHHIGYLLFDGRHEMSIGANIVDVANLLQRVTQQDIDLFDGEKLLNAIVVDGGSAMKVYAVETNKAQSAKVSMDLLNRVAAGGRNAPGDDPQGLNLYSTVSMELA